MPENYSGEADISSSIPAEPEYKENNQAAMEQSHGAQFSIIHTPPVYSAFGLIPSAVGNQFAPFESSEVQAHDSSSLTSFIVSHRNFSDTRAVFSCFYIHCSFISSHDHQSSFVSTQSIDFFFSFALYFFVILDGCILEYIWWKMLKFVAKLLANLTLLPDFLLIF